MESQTEHVRLHSTGGIVIWVREHEKQDREQFLQNPVILVRGRKSMGLDKHDFTKNATNTEFRGYSFPKGHIEANESEIDATYREIWEEAGLVKDQLELVSKIGYLVKSDRSNRQVHLYLFRLVNHDELPVLKPILTDEILEARWSSIQDIIEGKVKVKSELLSFFKNNLDQIHQEWNSQ
jgi:8-oxo-dGTP pyrophosphatase MutT (NUDIX family)